MAIDYPSHIEPLARWLSQGKTQKSYCDQAHIDNADLQKYLATSPNSQDLLLRARAMGAVCEVDEMVNIAARTDLHPGVQRNQIDVHKWRASKFLPKVFGDKLDVTVTEKLDISGALIEARQRRNTPVSNRPQSQITQSTEYTVLPRITRTDTIPVTPADTGDSGQAHASSWDPFE